MAVATNFILFILFIETSLFYHTEGQFYGEDPSVGYLMLGTHGPRVSIFSKKILSDLAIAFAIIYGLGNTN